MRKKYFFPKADAAFSPWTISFEAALGIPANVTALGLTTAEALALSNASKSIRLAVADVAAKATAYKDAVDLKDIQIKNASGIILPAVRRFKTAAGYTEALGQALGVIGDDEPVMDWSTFKPVITAIVRPGLVEIRFDKMGADGMNIYTRLKGQTVWVKLAYDQFSPYLDNRPVAAGQVENREYCAVAVLNDIEVSQRSDIISVAFAG